MSTELARTEFSAEDVQLIKDTICVGVTDGELKLFISQCQRTGLDPFARQMHAVKRWDAKLQRETMAIQVGIDGFRLIAERTGTYAGNDDPVFDTEDADHPNKATVTVWKLVGGQRVPFTRSARWKEFVQTTKQGAVTKFWREKPYVMLAKVAESMALRVAFPQELSGLYTSDEMGQSEHADPEAEPTPQHLQQQAALPAKPEPTPRPNGNGKPSPEAERLAADFIRSLQACQDAAECKRIVDEANAARNSGAVTGEPWNRVLAVAKETVARIKRTPDAAAERADLLERLAASAKVLQCQPYDLLATFAPVLQVVATNGLYPAVDVLSLPVLAELTRLAEAECEREVPAGA